MPSKLANRRRDAESQAFKAKIVSLRGEGKSMTEIAQKLGITKQYTSLVLNAAGLGGRLIRGTPAAKVQAKRDDNDEVQAAIARLRRQENFTLADNLRLILERRATAIKLRQAKRRANRKPI